MTRTNAAKRAERCLRGDVGEIDARYVRGVPVIVQVPNTTCERAFDCAEEYIDRFNGVNRWLGAIWFRKYTFQPGVVLRAGQEAPVRAFEAYESARIEDIVQPFIFAFGSGILGGL